MMRLPALSLLAHEADGPEGRNGAIAQAGLSVPLDDTTLDRAVRPARYSALLRKRIRITAALLPGCARAAKNRLHPSVAHRANANS
jgi:hypothetical protein